MSDSATNPTESADAIGDATYRVHRKRTSPSSLEADRAADAEKKEPGPSSKKQGFMRRSQVPGLRHQSSAQGHFALRQA